MQKIVKPQKMGGSVGLPLTGFVEIGKQYLVKKVGEDVIISEVKE